MSIFSRSLGKIAAVKAIHKLKSLQTKENVFDEKTGLYIWVRGVPHNN
jgi:hypothetical protein